MLMYEKDLAGDVKKLYNPVALPIDKFQVKVEVNLEKKDFEAAENYSYFLQQVHDDIQGRIETILETMAKELGKFDRAYYAAATLKLEKEKKKWKDSADKLLTQAEGAIKKAIEKALEDGFKRVAKMDGRVRNFKIKATIHIVLACVAIGVSIASFATQPVNPLGAVAGAVGLMQSAGTLIKTFRDLGVKLPALDKSIAEQFVKYKKAAEAAEKKRAEEEKKSKPGKISDAKKKEGAKVGLSSLTGGVSDLVMAKLTKSLPSLDALKSDIQLMEVKIDELELAARTASKNMAQYMDKAAEATEFYEKREKEFNAFLADLNKIGALCPPKVLEAQAKIIMPKKRKVIELEKKIREEIAKIEKIDKDVKEYRKRHKAYDDKCTELMKLHKTEKVAIFAKIVVAIGSLALGGSNPEDWAKTGDIIKSVYGLASGAFDASADTLIDLVG